MSEGVVVRMSFRRGREDIDLLESGCGLGRYEIAHVLRQDSTGVEYLAHVRGLEERVVVREYLPAGLVERSGPRMLTVRPGVAKTVVERGLAQFLAQYVALEHVDHPAIVRVRSCLRANGTGYAVLEHPEGETLSMLLAGGRALPPEVFARILALLVEGLDKVHRSGMLHCAIDPDRIFVRKDGTPVLMGFGSTGAGYASGFDSRAGHEIGGYAAPEQCGGGRACGPWTDIYRLAAVAYRCVSGRLPPDASQRLVCDRLIAAVDAASGDHDPRTLAAIDRALALDEGNRPATVAEWQTGFPASNPTFVDRVKSFTRAAPWLGERRKFSLRRHE